MCCRVLVCCLCVICLIVIDVYWLGILLFIVFNSFKLILLGICGLRLRWVFVY